MQNGKRVRTSLKTRDIRRAARRLAEMDEEALGRPRKTLDDAIDAFHAQHAEHADETKRKYRRVLAYLEEYCGRQQLRYVDQIAVESMDGYALWRNKTNWTWIKEIEILRQFFAFSIDREWTRKNPARALKRPRLLEANDVVPFTSEEIVRTIAACEQIGRAKYERLRARAMVLLMRYAGLRVSDVVTLSRDHIKGNHLEKRAVKNRRMIRVELHPDVLKALDVLPLPKAAPRECKLFFSGGNASVRSLVKGAQRTLSWWPGTESNRRRQPFQGCALPTELPGRQSAIVTDPCRGPPCYRVASAASSSPVAFSTSACRLLPCASMVTMAANPFTFRRHMASGMPNSIR
jgi:site-specific recombinase XerC